jgi:hypothetical protein
VSRAGFVRAAIVAALLGAAAPAAAARTADYAMSEEQFAALAAQLDVDAFPPMPARSSVDVALADPSALDHRMRVLGISCSAWNVDNPISQMVKRALIAFDRDGDLASAGTGPRISLVLDGASSSLRCVQVKELKQRCMLRTAITGMATREEAGKAPVTVPVAVELDQEQKMSGPCNGMAQGASILGRSASIALAEKLREFASR